MGVSLSPWPLSHEFVTDCVFCVCVACAICAPHDFAAYMLCRDCANHIFRLEEWTRSPLVELGSSVARTAVNDPVARFGD